MVTPEGLLKVLDFGIAKLQDSEDPDATAEPGCMTEDGKILGTVGYMSPEQAAGQRAVHASDQFSLGTILYEMVTGKAGLEAQHRGGDADGHHPGGSPSDRDGGPGYAPGPALDR